MRLPETPRSRRTRPVRVLHQAFHRRGLRVSFHKIQNSTRPSTSSSRARVGGVGRGFVLTSREGMGWRVFMRRVERERGGKTGTPETGTPEKSIAREDSNGIAIRALKNGHCAHSAPVWRAKGVGIVLIHGWDAPEIIIATVAVDLDSNPPLGALVTLVLFPSQFQLEARSMSLVKAFSSRAERRDARRFPRPLCLAPARISAYVMRHAGLPYSATSRIRIVFCFSRAYFKDIGQSAMLAGSARGRARPRPLRWCFSAPSPRENPHPLPHLTCARHDDRTTTTTITRAPRAECGSRLKSSRLIQCGVPPIPLPKAHCARATTGTTPKRHIDGDGGGGIARGGGGGMRETPFCIFRAYLGIFE